MSGPTFLRVVPEGDETAADPRAEGITEAQAATLRELCDRQGLPFDGNLSRAQAEERIEALRKNEET